MHFEICFIIKVNFHKELQQVCLNRITFLTLFFLLYFIASVNHIKPLILFVVMDTVLFNTCYCIQISAFVEEKSKVEGHKKWSGLGTSTTTTNSWNFILTGNALSLRTNRPLSANQCSKDICIVALTLTLIKYDLG